MYIMPFLMFVNVLVPLHNIQNRSACNNHAYLNDEKATNSEKAKNCYEFIDTFPAKWARLNIL